jgi:hypothetical protein
MLILPTRVNGMVLVEESLKRLIVLKMAKLTMFLAMPGKPTPYYLRVRKKKAP